MKTLLMIHSYASALPQVTWTWPQYLVPGFDILGLTPVDQPHDWPNTVRSANVGRGGYIDTLNPARRLVASFKYVLRSPQFRYYTDFCLIEHDGFFLRKPPPHPGGLVTTLAGGPLPTFKAKQFFHTPWWPDRATAAVIVMEGSKMMHEGEWEWGAPDFFLGRIVDRTGIPWTNANAWSVNGHDFQNRKASLPDAIKRGAWYVHGVRTKEEMDWAVQLAKEP